MTSSNKIRVCSYLLSPGSPVFKSMLDPHFKEGTTLATSSSVEIPLPEDNFEAMTTLCRILHQRYAALESKPDPKNILAISTLVDKYDCAEAVAPIAQCWVGEYLDRLVFRIKPSHQSILSKVKRPCASSPLMPKLTSRLATRG